MQGPEHYQFGPFALDSARRVLCKHEQPVPLTPKAFDILLALVERRGEVVDKDQLMQRVWPDQAIEEGNLTVNVSALRKALGDSVGEHRYVVTIPGRGYKFAAPVTVGESVARLAPATGDGERVPTWPRFALATAVFMVLAGASWWLLSGRPMANAETIRSVAVLPFVHVVESDRDESLELGLADVVSTKLAVIRELVVSPATALRRYATNDRDPIRVGRELGVDSVLDGTIHRDGQRLRITARLLLVRDGSARWADQFDAPFGDLLKLEDLLSTQVARALRGELTGGEAQRLAERGTDSVEAHREYLIGRLHWNRMTLEGWKKSAEHFERAVAADGSYALAHAGLADAYVSLASDAPPESRSLDRAQQAARMAVKLDQLSPEAHVALGRVQAYHEWDWAAAGESFRRAIELTPNGSDAHREYGLCLASQGSTDEAVAETRRALQLDPVNLFNNFAVGWALIGARRYDELIEHFKKSLEIDPRFVAAHHFIGLGYVGKRMFREGIAEIEKASALSTDNLLVLANLGFAHAAAGDKIRAERILEGLQQLAVSRYVSPYYLATILAGLGRTDQAFELLERAYADRSRRLWALKVGPQWDGLRADLRFEDLMRRVRLAD